MTFIKKLFGSSDGKRFKFRDTGTVEDVTSFLVYIYSSVQQPFKDPSKPPEDPSRNKLHLENENKWKQSFAAKFFDNLEYDGPPEKIEFSQFKLTKKWRLYTRAAMLRVLIMKSKEDNSYSELLKQYEKLLFGGNVHSVEGLRELADIKEAMGNIQDLVNDKDKSFRWARIWLSDIGFNVSNPVTLMELIQYIFSRTKLVRNLIAEAKPC